MVSAAERPGTRSLRPLRALIPFLRPYRRTLLFAVAALLLASLAQLTVPISIRFLIDRGLLRSGGAPIDGYFLAMFAVVAAFGMFSALRFYLVTSLGERVVADIRNAVYRHVIRLDPLFYETTRSGEVLSRLTTDTTLIQSISGAGLSIVLRSGVNLLGATTMLAVTSAGLTALILGLVPLIVLPIVLVGRRLRTLSRASQDRIADTSGLAGETLNAIATVQAFTLERLQSERYATAVHSAYRTALRRIRLRALLTAVAVLFVFGSITLVLWLGARSVVAGRMSAGELGQFLVYAIFVATSAGALSEMWGEVQRAAGAMERLVELLAAEPRIRPPRQPLRLPEPAEGRIEFRDVEFAYPARTGVRAVDGFSLSVAAGETVAVVGPSGAGKSTLFQLLLRFYDPDAGSILVDGVNIASVDPEALRARIGVVPQETVIFGATARENIRYGRPDAADGEIESAARLAAADEFIRRLPEGYDTFLGERGTRLSGGQRQRIAIARALLRDPPILLLDEATSSLDAESERLIQDALERLMAGRTTLIIAHRLATVLKAARIVVMEHGRLVESGTHAELLSRDALYARLARLQFADMNVTQ